MFCGCLIRLVSGLTGATFFYSPWTFQSKDVFLAAVSPSYFGIFDKVRGPRSVELNCVPEFVHWLSDSGTDGRADAPKFVTFLYPDAGRC